MRSFIAAFLLPAAVCVSISSQAVAEKKDNGAAAPAGDMNNARLDALIRKIDPKTEGKPGYWQFRLEDRPVIVITDEKMDRMRIISPVASAEKLTSEQLTRMMQANFDTALDARYAIAKGTVWSSFLHPLGALTDVEFLAGVGQVVNLAATYGESYSSGLLSFGGGDSNELRRRQLIERLMKKRKEI